MNHFYKNFILVTSNNNPSHAFVLMRNNSCMISNFVNMCCWIIPWSHLWITLPRENYNTRFTYRKTIRFKSNMMIIITIFIHTINYKSVSIVFSIFPIPKKFRLPVILMTPATVYVITYICIYTASDVFILQSLFCRAMSSEHRLAVIICWKSS